MRVLIIGARGMLGQALRSECRRSGHFTAGVSRGGSRFEMDLLQPQRFPRILRDSRPDVVVNAAAIVDVSQCESDPETALAVNGDAVCRLTDACKELGVPFVQVSTDHFFTGDGNGRHDEDAPISLLNMYARSKQRGESCALRYAKALIVRTNITGFRGVQERPTFIEWALAALRDEATVTGFDDWFISTIDTVSFSRALLQLIERRVYGVFHLASRDVFSKYDFLTTLANSMNNARAPIQRGSVTTLSPRRAESLGLDCQRVQHLLDAPLPGLAEVINNLLEQEESFNSAG